jgi:hypothetical protein
VISGPHGADAAWSDSSYYGFEIPEASARRTVQLLPAAAVDRSGDWRGGIKISLGPLARRRAAPSATTTASTRRRQLKRP